MLIPAKEQDKISLFQCASFMKYHINLKEAFFLMRARASCLFVLL